MSNLDALTLLSYHSLTAPLIQNPVSELDIIVNKLRRKYRTYVVDFDREHGYGRLPPLFVHDFGDQINRFATLVDSKNNEFEVLVERNNTGIYLTKGWMALRDFYNDTLGSWVSMVFVGLGRFEITMKDRFGRKIRVPRFSPAMRFEVDRNLLPFLMNNVVPSPFEHDEFSFQFSYEKRMTGEEIDSGWMMLADVGFCQLVLHPGVTSLKMVDECGNKWLCMVTYATMPYAHYNIGGGLKRMMDARRIRRGSHVMFGASFAGYNDTFYFRVIHF